MVDREVSRITKANKISKSVKTTIPNKIADHLELSEGDAIGWEPFTEKGEKYARVKKLE